MKKGFLVIAAMFCMLLIPGKVQASATTVDMQRLYNPNSGEHFYTADVNEKNSLVAAGWQYEGIGWTAPEKSETPVYRLYNANAGDHHYTMSEDERSSLKKAGWKDEGIGWYSDDFQTIPLYRQYNPNAVAGSHNYTVDKAENDSLVAAGWNAEGIGWYGTTAEVMREDAPQILEQGSSLCASMWNNCRVAYIGAKVKNPNAYKTAEGVELLWIACDSNGGTLATCDIYVGDIAPGDTVDAGTTYLYYGDTTPSYYEVKVKKVESYGSTYCIPALLLPISNLSGSTYDTTIRGIVTNNSDKECKSVTVTILYYKDGQLVGGNMNDRIYWLKSGEIRDFTIDTWQGAGVPEYDALETKARGQL